MGSLASHIMIPRHVSPACDKEPIAGVLYVRPNISLRPSIPSNRLHRGALMHAERSEEQTSELQSLMRISYAVFCLKKKKQTHKKHPLYRITHATPHH